MPIAHAVDGGGSTRIPAACCGLVGMKPTTGRLPTMRGTEAMPVPIVSHGVVTRSVRDHAAFYAAAEAHGPMPGAPPIGRVEGPGAQRLRVGLLTEAIRGIPIDDDTTRAVRDAGELCESLGHSVGPLSMPDWGWMEDDLLTTRSGIESSLGTPAEHGDVPRLMGPQEVEHRADIGSAAHQRLDVREVLAPSRPQLHEHQHLDADDRHEVRPSLGDLTREHRILRERGDEVDHSPLDHVRELLAERQQRGGRRERLWAHEEVHVLRRSRMTVQAHREATCQRVRDPEVGQRCRHASGVVEHSVSDDLLELLPTAHLCLATSARVPSA